MRTGIFDLETSSLYADSGIILCAHIKTYGKRDDRTIRADRFPTWKNNKSNNGEIVRKIIEDLQDYDILVAHNGQYFDKAWLNAACLQYGIEPTIRFKKFIDPVMIARRHLRLGRNGLNALIDYFSIPDQKTHLALKRWIEASLDGNTQSMDYIVKHCVKDVHALEGVYNKVRKLVKDVNERGSS